MRLATSQIRFNDENPDYIRLTKMVKANGEGRFVFPDVAPGSYYLTGFVTWCIPNEYAANGCLTQGGALMENVTVTNATDKLDVVMNGLWDRLPRGFDGGVAVAGQRDGPALLGVSHGTDADQLAALLGPETAAAGVDPRRPGGGVDLNCNSKHFFHFNFPNAVSICGSVSVEETRPALTRSSSSEETLPDCETSLLFILLIVPCLGMSFAW
jgi:hypothetical protein